MDGSFSSASSTASSSDENSPRYEGWRVVFAAGMGVFLASPLVYTFPMLLRPLSEEFGWSREEISVAYGMITVMSAAGALPFGFLIDRFGPRTIVITSLTSFALVFASIAALTPRLWHLYTVFALAGFMVTGTSPVAYVRTVSSWFDRRRGLALALAIAGGSIGGIVHPPASHALMTMFGWRGAIAIFGVMIFALGVPTAFAFIRERPGARASSNTGSGGASVAGGLSSRVFWIVLLVLFVSSIVQNATIVHLPALLIDRGVPAAQSTIAISAFGAASLAGRLSTGWLIDRFPAPRVAFWMLALAGLGGFLLSEASSFTTGLLAAVLIGLGTGGEADVVPYLLSRYFGLRSFSTLYGFAWVSTAMAGAVGPVLMGRAFDATGSYETVLIRLGLATIGAAGLMLLLPRYDSSPAGAVALTASRR